MIDARIMSINELKASLASSILRVLGALRDMMVSPLGCKKPNHASVPLLSESLHSRSRTV